MLEVREVTRKFGNFIAVNKCSIDVEEGTVVGLIGPNGAGKTTLINVISGDLRANGGGRILFKGKKITNKAPYKITRMGIGRTYQITKIFWSQSVWKNIITAGLALNGNREEVEAAAKEKIELLEIGHIWNHPAWMLSVGQKKLLELAMKLMLDPELLILDEPFQGIHPSLVEKIIGRINALKALGKTFLVVSHDLKSITTISDKVIVMNFGEVISEGTPAEIREDQRVIDVYLGGN